VSSSSNPRQNRLLAALPSEEYERFLPQLELVALDFKKILYQPNEPIEFVYFVLSGVVSLLTILNDDTVVEVATVGNEGFVGLPLFLGATQIPGQALSQIPGTAMQMRAEIFRREVTQETTLFVLLQRYTQALFNQVAQSAACNRIHTIEERFCRWILMTRDRVPGDTFPLTHEFLGQMLGVRRASVTEVAIRMQNAGLIRYKYGKMTVLDRQGLESASCECYQIVKREFERLVGGN
jgi:CRP-like cAMP-binding protein